MKQSVFITVLLALALLVSTVIYFFLLPQFIKDGGYLVIALLALSLMVITFVIERTISLKKAEGKSSLAGFLKEFEVMVQQKKIDDAVKLCEGQGGSVALILQTGLERYVAVQRKKLTPEKQVAVVQRAIEEATALETPLLEKNLIALSTIASISTMVGLLGTTLGMIRSFQALATTGAPDAVQLSLGISEALVNTAGGLFAAIAAIVAYNVFINKVDNFTYMLDEAVYNVIQTITVEEEEA